MILELSDPSGQLYIPQTNVRECIFPRCRKIFEILRVLIEGFAKGPSPLAPRLCCSQRHVHPDNFVNHLCENDKSRNSPLSPSKA